MEPIKNTSEDEKELLLRLREGDERAFAKLFDGYSSLVTAHLNYVLKSSDLAQEVSQETFVALWDNRESVDPEKSIKSYLFKIATNKSYNLFKRAAHDKALRARMLPIVEAGYNNIESYLQRKDNQELINALLDKMPAKQREVFTLFKIEGYSYQEISEKLGLSHSTINTHINRANQFIKAAVQRNPALLVALLFLPYTATW